MEWTIHPPRILFLLLYLSFPGIAQESSSLVFRSQYESIAGELADSMGLSAGNNLFLVIEESRQPRLAENAFVNIFQQRGIRVGFSQKEYPILRIFVLRETEEPNPASARHRGRILSLALEARSEFSSSGPVRYWGRFDRTYRDSVAAGKVPEPSASSFERILEPRVVVAGSVLIVYLLFTVRN